MLVSSVVLDSFQEYEGKQSLVLFCRGCNLKCPGCYNYKTVTSVTLGESKDIIPALLTPLHEAVVFLGGEPTIYGEELARNCRLVKSFSRSVKVFTNGMLPNTIKQLVSEKVVDSMSFDFKAVSRCSEIVGIDITDSNYIRTVSESINAAYGKIDMEIRTTAFLEMSAVEVEAVKNFVAERWPQARHVIQKDFREVNPRVQL